MPPFDWLAPPPTTSPGSTPGPAIYNSLTGETTQQDLNSVADPALPTVGSVDRLGGALTFILVNFPRKLHKNENKLDWGRTPLRSAKAMRFECTQFVSEHIALTSGSLKQF